MPAEVLSRVDAVSLPQLPDLAERSRLQVNDEGREMLGSSPRLQLQHVAFSGNITVASDTKAGKPRPIVPASLSRNLFNATHSLSHPDVRATTQLMTSRYVWPSIKTGVRDWARSCITCQQVKVQCCKLPTKPREVAFSSRTRESCRRREEPRELGTRRLRDWRLSWSGSPALLCLIALTYFKSFAYRFAYIEPTRAG